MNVYEDELTLAFMDIMPSVEGHTLVIPKEPAETIFDLSPEGAAATIRTTQKVAAAVKKAFDAPGIMLVQLNGAAAGQTHSASAFPHPAARGRPRSEMHGRTMVDAKDARADRRENPGRAMILEHAVLNVRSGQSRQFEQAMGKARAADRGRAGLPAAWKFVPASRPRTAISCLCGGARSRLTRSASAQSPRYEDWRERCTFLRALPGRAALRAAALGMIMARSSSAPSRPSGRSRR